MVTKTQEPVSDSPPAASEDKPPASKPPEGQELAAPSQEPGIGPEGNAVEKWFSENPDKFEALVAGRVAEATKRAEQSGFDQGQESWKVKQRLADEEAALVKEQEGATEALRKAAKAENVDSEEIVRLAHRMAQAGAVAEHIPHLRREYRDAREELPFADQWTAAELTAFAQRGPTGKREGVNVLRAVHEATWRQATERADARWDGWLKGLPAPTNNEPRTPVPPNLGAGGVPLASASDTERLARIATNGGTEDDKRWWNEKYGRQRPAARGV
jgi:hypothetical protein